MSSRCFVWFVGFLARRSALSFLFQASPAASARIKGPSASSPGSSTVPRPPSIAACPPVVNIYRSQDSSGVGGNPCRISAENRQSWAPTTVQPCLMLGVGWMLLLRNSLLLPPRTARTRPTLAAALQGMPSTLSARRHPASASPVPQKGEVVRRKKQSKGVRPAAWPGPNVGGWITGVGCGLRATLALCVPETRASRTIIEACSRSLLFLLALR